MQKAPARDTDMAKNVQKVFLSYRRGPSKWFALRVYDALQDAGFDVFIDVVNLASGRFDKTLLTEVEAIANHNPQRPDTHRVRLLVPQSCPVPIMTSPHNDAGPRSDAGFEKCAVGLTGQFANGHPGSSLACPKHMVSDRTEPMTTIGAADDHGDHADPTPADSTQPNGQRHPSTAGLHVRNKAVPET